MDNDQRSQQPAPQMSPPAPEQSVKTASPEQSRKELTQAIAGSNDVLGTARTTLTLFPDTITLDRAKLTVTKRQFFSTAEVVSIRIEDIMNVTLSVGPLFGYLKIASRVMNAGPYKLGKLRRDDAMRIKRVTQGYVIALQRNIDCNSLLTPELIKMLDQLGEDDHPTG